MKFVIFRQKGKRQIEYRRMKDLTMHIELTRDSVCAGDDMDAPHKTIIAMNSITETIALVTKISQKYLPNIAGQNHHWECLLNGKIIAVIEKDKILPKISCVKYEEDNKIHFTYYPALD